MSTPGTKRLTKFPKKSACAIIMFKRLFGQPSGSVTRGGGSRGGDGRSTGSTSTGRAAFDAVDKLKDVRLCRFLSLKIPPQWESKIALTTDDAFKHSMRKQSSQSGLDGTVDPFPSRRKVLFFSVRWEGVFSRAICIKDTDPSPISPFPLSNCVCFDVQKSLSSTTSSNLSDGPPTMNYYYTTRR